MFDSKGRILEKITHIKREGFKEFSEWLFTTDYFTAPASTKFHNNCVGGLAHHSNLVTDIYLKLNEVFKRGIPLESIYIAGLFHDVCKVNFYTTEKRNRKVNDKWESYDCYAIEDQEPLGHGTKSVIILSRFFKLTKLETYSILYHMGLPETYAERQSFSSACEMYPDLILLHNADTISSTLYEKTY